MHKLGVICSGGLSAQSEKVRDYLMKFVNFRYVYEHSHKSFGVSFN